MRSLFLAGLLASVSLLAQTSPDFIPLQLGNQWVYQVAGLPGAEPKVVSIERVSEFDGQLYYMYASLDGPRWIRGGSDGALYLYDPQSKTERVVIAPDGVVTPFFSDCGQIGRVVSTNADYKGPLGTLDGVIEVRYSPGSCRDAGIERELYLPYVGLIQRTETTIAGPRTYNLVYARLGGVTVISASETSFTLALDAKSYEPGSTARARLALRNAGQDPLVLDFRSGQEFDIVVRNERGEAVWVWSAGRGFIQALHRLEISGEKNWVATIPLGGLPPGRYTAEAFLTTVRERAYVATLEFMINGPQPAQQ